MAVITAKDMVQRACEIHGCSPTAAAALAFEMLRGIDARYHSNNGNYTYDDKVLHLPCSFQPHQRDTDKIRIPLIALFSAACRTSAAAVFTAALLGMGAADTGFAAFLCSKQIGDDSADDKGNN